MKQKEPKKQLGVDQESATKAIFGRNKTDNKFSDSRSFFLKISRLFAAVSHVAAAAAVAVGAEGAECVGGLIGAGQAQWHEVGGGGGRATGIVVSKQIQGTESETDELYFCSNKKMTWPTNQLLRPNLPNITNLKQFTRKLNFIYN